MRIIRLDVPSGDSAEAWDAIIRCACFYDFYHLAGYHLLAFQRGEGTPFLFVVEDAGHFVALPLLLRPVEGGSRRGLEQWFDATSVYGYAGPVTSKEDLPSSLVTKFRIELATTLRDMRVVSVFSRLHPLFPQVGVLQGLGRVKAVGTTVSINLELQPEEQWAQYRENHRRDIRRLRRLGWASRSCAGQSCVDEYVDSFLETYRATMDRLNASGYYYFDRQYVRGLLSISGVEFRIFLAESSGTIGAAGIFSLCNGIVQYHLGGTKTEFLKYAPMKMLFDDVRLWASRVGATRFHLGGGVGGTEDSLFRFKAGFSTERHEFQTWRWVLDDEAYRALCRGRGIQLHSEGDPYQNDFFPLYRSPSASVN